VASSLSPFRPDLLAGKTTVITGGGTGLGRSMALRLAELGARVALLGRRPEPLQKTAAEIEKSGGRAAAVPCDIRDSAAVQAAFDAAEQQLGPANQLINNAAGNFLCPSEDLSDNGFDSVVRIVLYGSFHATRELGRRLIAQQGQRRGPLDRHDLLRQRLGVRAAVGGGQGRSARDDALAGGRSGRPTASA
jgi:NAD(P)-dependent dehydrogenase (short-subunit alcohol dehydrogenase family)